MVNGKHYFPPKNFVFLLIPKSTMHLYFETEQFVRLHLLACRMSRSCGRGAAISPFLQVTKQRL